MKWIIIDRGLIHMIILENAKSPRHIIAFWMVCIYSYIDDMYETILCSLQAGRFINRGFLMVFYLHLWIECPHDDFYIRKM